MVPNGPPLTPDVARQVCPHKETFAAGDSTSTSGQELTSVWCALEICWGIMSRLVTANPLSARNITRGAAGPVLDPRSVPPEPSDQSDRLSPVRRVDQRFWY